MKGDFRATQVVYFNCYFNGYDLKYMQSKVVEL